MTPGPHERIAELDVHNVSIGCTYICTCSKFITRKLLPKGSCVMFRRPYQLLQSALLQNEKREINSALSNSDDIINICVTCKF